MGKEKDAKAEFAPLLKAAAPPLPQSVPELVELRKQIATKEVFFFFEVFSFF
jgi:hypothetical protein